MLVNVTDQDESDKIRKDRREGLTYRELCKKYRKNPKQLKTILTQFEAKEVTENREASEILSLVKDLVIVSNAKTVSEAVKNAVDLTAQFNSYAYNYGCKTPIDMINLIGKLHKEDRETIETLGKQLSVYTEMNEREALKWIGISDKSLALMDKIARKKNVSPDKYDIASMVNGVIKEYFKFSDWHLIAVEIPPLRGAGGEKSVMVYRMNEQQIRELYDK